MIRVLSPLPCFWIEQQGGTEWWIVRRGGIIRVEINGVVYEVGIPDGFWHNRASIPDCLEWIVSKDDCGTEAPPPHDGAYALKGRLPFAPPTPLADGRNAWENPCPWCCPHHVFTRAEADEMFYQIMVMDTGRTFKARLAWLAVRVSNKDW